MYIFSSKIPTVFFLFLITFSIDAPAAKLLEPGHTLILQSEGDPVSADGTDASCTQFPLFPPKPSYLSCGTEQAGQQFGVRATAHGSFAKGQGTALQFYDFEIDEGDSSETPLLSQISGKANFNGFLALVGGGQVKGNLKLKLIDLGPTGAFYPDGGKVVHQETLASHQLTGIAVTGLNFGITVEGGAPYIGIGASPEFKVNIQLQKELVRDKIDFGVHALLLRGHTYRVQFEVGVLAKKDVVPGLSIAQFKLGDDRAPDLFDPEHWLEGINDLVITDLPAIKAQTFNIKEEDENGILQLFSKPRLLDGAPGFSDSKDMLRKLADDAGLPTSFREIVDQRLSRSSILEEGIASPGAEVRELIVTLETDQVEILRHHTVLLYHMIDLLNTPPGQRPAFPLKK
jgi:hypothetical protein